MKFKNKNTLVQKEPAVILTNVSKTYVLRHVKPTLTDFFMSPLKKNKEFVALDSVSLTIHKGEKVGIMGANGAGKTTILKLIAGITTPTSGSVEVRGRVVSLIDLAAGFHEDLSGSENIFLNGTIIGMSIEEIKSRYESIVAFADIGDFIDQPVYTYSSGMLLRLGFSVAIHSNPDIFLLDEGFVVGDKDFRGKCERKLQELMQQNKTIIIVSHWLEFLQKNVETFFYIDSNRKITRGDYEMVVKKLDKK